MWRPLKRWWKYTIQRIFAYSLFLHLRTPLPRIIATPTSLPSPSNANIRTNRMFIYKPSAIDSFPHAEITSDSISISGCNTAVRATLETPFFRCPRKHPGPQGHSSRFPVGKVENPSPRYTLQHRRSAITALDDLALCRIANFSLAHHPIITSLFFSFFFVQCFHFFLIATSEIVGGIVTLVDEHGLKHRGSPWCHKNFTCTRAFLLGIQSAPTAHHTFFRLFFHLLTFVVPSEKLIFSNSLSNFIFMTLRRCSPWLQFWHDGNLHLSSRKEWNWWKKQSVEKN